MHRSSITVTLFFCLLVGIVSAIPKPNKTRVKDEVQYLQVTFISLLCIYVSILNQPLLLFLLLQPLSDKKHFDKEEHNADYGKSDVILLIIILLLLYRQLIYY